MRFPSPTRMISSAKTTVLRFPLVLLTAIFLTVVACILVDHKGDDTRLQQLSLAALLGLPLLTALTLAGERQGSNVSRPGFVGQGLGLALLAWYFFSLPVDIDDQTQTRFFMFFTGAHLLVAFLPTYRCQRLDGFWQFNVTLLLRLVAGLGFTFVLWGGLSLAIAALNELFGFNIDYQWYMRLAIVLACVFNTWFVLAGLPRDLEGLHPGPDYPRILKIFAQYILASLVIVYLVILVAYLVKVLVTGVWPSGWIGWLVSGVAMAGLLSLVLLHPLLDDDRNKWLRTYARLFFILLLPAIAMLLMAIFKRMSQYGVTEPRYFLLVLTAWLTAIAGHGLLVKRRSIRIIPVTLCLLVVVCSFGPWSAFSLSRHSQMARLTSVLEANALLVDGKLVPAETGVGADDSHQIFDGLKYLVDKHGLDNLRPWFSPDLAETLDTAFKDGNTNKKIYRRGYEAASLVTEYLNVERLPVNMASKQIIQIHREQDTAAVALDGYDYAVNLGSVLALRKSAERTFVLDGDDWVVRWDPDNFAIDVSTETIGQITLPLEDMFTRLEPMASQSTPMVAVPDSLLAVDVFAGDIKAGLRVTTLNVSIENEDPKLVGLSGLLLITKSSTQDR